ncbi:MAG: Bifunctional protein GlmU [Holosporales bacterium]
MLGVLILAAGQGKRMKSSLPKVMHTVAGKMMIDHTIDLVQKLSCQQIIVVSSPLLKEHYKNNAIDYALQEHPLGTAHAVQCGIDKLDPKITHVLILCGDTPLITFETIKNLTESKTDLTVLGMALPQSEQHKGYGRFIIQDDCLKAIVEMKDATPDQKKISLANAGVYFGTVQAFKICLPLIKNTNEAHEYYLTDCVDLAIKNKFTVAYQLCAFEETIGVNSRQDQAIAESIMQDRLRAFHMQNGATLIDPKTVYFQTDTQIGQDVIIYPHVVFGKNVVVDDAVTIYDHCHLSSCHLMASSKVGPFAHLRDGVTLYPKAEVGNFVELKKTTLKQGAKVKHLTYLGDTDVGIKANIGAGTVTCNYNGFIKQKTVIQDGAFIGGQSTLIAPVVIGQGAMVAAGSVITQDVQDNALAIARPQQIEKPDWVIKFKDQNQT